MMIEALKGSGMKQKSCGDADKVAVLTAWHRVDCRTREAFRRSFLPELISGYEVTLRSTRQSIITSSSYHLLPYIYSIVVMILYYLHALCCL